jgi:hypothetical protein
MQIIEQVRINCSFIIISSLFALGDYDHHSVIVSCFFKQILKEVD